MPTLMITAVYEGEPVHGLRAGTPIPNVPVHVGRLGAPTVEDVTDERGTATVDVEDTGSWTVSVVDDREGGSLRGLMQIDVPGPIAMLALPVRWSPA